jgi:hypothetical protein
MGFTVVRRPPAGVRVEVQGGKAGDPFGKHSLGIQILAKGFRNSLVARLDGVLAFGLAQNPAALPGMREYDCTNAFRKPVATSPTRSKNPKRHYHHPVSPAQCHWKLEKNSRGHHHRHHHQQHHDTTSPEKETLLQRFI